MGELNDNIYEQHNSRSLAQMVAILFEIVKDQRKKPIHPLEVKKVLMEEMRMEPVLRDEQEITV